MSTTFGELFGAAAVAVYAAPGRVNLIGEYTDLNDSFVLPFATAEVTTVEVRRRTDRIWKMASDGVGGGSVLTHDLDTDGLPPGWGAYPVAVARALENAGHRVGGLDLLVRSDVPTGAGLSSSAALECAVGLALCDQFGVDLQPMELAVLAREAENRYVGVPCGIMDQAASLCCEQGHAMLLDTRSLEIRQLPLALEGSGLALLLVDTRVKHALVSSAYANRRHAFAEAARRLGVRTLREAIEAGIGIDALAGDDELYRRARHVVSEHNRVLEAAQALASGDERALGALLSASHASLRDDLEVSCAELDLAVDAAMAAGALGARLTGAGFGGSAIALVEAGRAGEVAAAVADAFSSRRLTAPSLRRVAASSGARRVR